MRVACVQVLTDNNLEKNLIKVKKLILNRRFGNGNANRWQCHHKERHQGLRLAHLGRTTGTRSVVEGHHYLT